MRRRFLIAMTLAATALGVLIAVALTTALVTPAGAAGCGPCQGPVRQVSGHGSGSSCAAALDAAEQDALTKAFANAPQCVPCAISNGPQACYLPGSGGAAYGATWTLYHQCRSCSFDPDIPLP